ncbi:MAG TPA: hypothetical protein VHA77_19080, partial [Xanthobacteraceae bacterium]|nr:hypothetical protein [Xanthobacteraceae bacterium]
MTSLAASSRAPVVGKPWGRVLESARRLGGFKVVLPFVVLVAIWWAIKAGAGLSDEVLVSPLHVWRTFEVLVSHGILAEYAS